MVLFLVRHRLFIFFDLWSESVNELLQRVAAARAEAQALGQDAVWVTHAGVLRALALLDQGLRTLDQAPQWPQAVAGWGEWQLQHW